MKTLRAAALLCLALWLCLIVSCNDATKPPPEPVLVSITVTTPPDKTFYMAGETFDPAGLVVTGTYDNGETGTVTGYALGEPDMTTAGEKTVAVTLKGMTSEFTITVSRKVASIAITTPPARIVYYRGETFDPAGLVVTGTYDDGETGTLTGYALSEPDLTTEGEKTVAVTLGSLSAEFTITVRKALASIAITTPPERTNYYPGDAFDPAGLLVTGTYDDGETEAVTGYALSEPDMETGGAKTITVTLGALSAEFAITVRALASIAVTTQPGKIRYRIGEEFDPAGLVVTGTYDDDSARAETGYALDGDGPFMEPGERTVTIALRGFTASVPITVESAALTSIAVTTRPNKTAYYRDETFDPAGLVVTGTYDDGETGAVTGYTLGEPDLTTEGEKTVAVTLGALSAEFAITVRALVSIAVTTPPDKIVYYQGESFDPAGMVVTGTYDDNSARAETGYALDGAGPFTEPGERTVTVALRGFTASVLITVEPAALVSMAVASPPAKTLYRIGETFDPAGMVLTGTYTDGTTRPVTGFTAAADTSAAGEISVTLTLEGKNATTLIYVTGGTLTSLTIKTLPDKDVYFPGESLDLTGLELEGAHADLPGNRVFPVAVTAQDVAGYNSQTRGSQTLTVSMGGASVEFDILLRDKPYIYFDYGRRRTNLDRGGSGYTVPLYRDLVLAPIKWYISDNAVYHWELDGETQAGVAGEYLTLNFNRPNKKGTHTVKVTVTDGGVSVSAETLVECLDQEGTYRRDKDDNSKARSNKVFDFVPAPGQFVTITASDTQETVLAQAQLKNDEEADGLNWRWSLGSWGGYIIFGFDHSIINAPNNEYDLAIAGNGFTAWAEPGVVWVSQDDNGNGVPDDTWYELKGAAYGNPDTTQRYAVTYYKPTGEKGPVWVDNQGNTGTFPSKTYYGESQGYPHHAGGDYVTFTGTRLPNHVDFGELVTNPSVGWGYVDDVSDYFRIEDAAQADGTPVNLKYIDFVKVHTGQNAYAGILGEVSTETSQAYDYSLFH